MVVRTTTLAIVNAAGRDVTRLEDLWPNAAVRGVLPDALVTVVSVHWLAGAEMPA